MMKKISKKILVTGGTGFVGQNLLPRLVRAGLRVTLLARPGKKFKTGPAGIKIISHDLTKKSVSAALVKKNQVIIHLAGLVDIDESLRQPEKHLATNLLMLLNVLEAARLAKNKPLFIFSSTDRSYGRTKRKIVGESEPTFPIEPYTASKLLAEKIIEIYHRWYGIPYIIFRIDSIYGPGQPTRMFISDVIGKMLRGEKIIAGGLAVRKNFIYVGDLAGAFLRAARSSPAAWNNIYNVGGRQESLKEVLKILDKIVEKKTGFKNVLAVKKASAKRNRRYEVNPFVLSTGKIFSKLSWRPTTTLVEGLNKTVNYFISKYEK